MDEYTTSFICTVVVGILSPDATFSKLPGEVIGKSQGENSIADSNENNPISFLGARLRKDDLENLEEELMKRFPLSKERQVFKKRIRRRGCPKSQTLSNTKKRALGLYSIERKGLLYKDLLPLHEMWKNYMEGYLDLPRLRASGFSGDLSTPQSEEVGQLLFKADYHGAYISVSKSIAPSLVGLGGILIFETKNTLKLLGSDNITRCVPKASCEFELLLGILKLNFLGKNFLVRPPDRSSKKLRGNKAFQL